MKFYWTFVTKIANIIFELDDHPTRRDKILRHIILALFTVCICFGCTFFMPDNPVEEFVEDIVKEKTGMKLDISGDTPEDD